MDDKEKVYSMLPEEDKIALEIGRKVHQKKKYGIFWHIVKFFVRKKPKR